ncbi:MAG: sigma-70 family RNA polymerase sigma factor [Oscillospiraceae bacterium]|jgi:RNA polymerase sigma factor (sigma-70 family)|nr:sigma-70 family RNA polymerase sigma factor [Oscillospiraceae bacterium]
MLTQDEQRRVIDRVLSGDVNAFGLLVEDQSKVVYNLCLRMVNNEQDAYDLSQDAFLKAYTNLSLFRGDSKFSSWLYKLTTNVCLDFLRKRSRQKTVPLTYETDDGEQEYLPIPDETFSPETEAERRELRSSVRRGLSQLPEGQRQILILREIGQLSYEEIAGQLGLEAGTVKSRIFRARKKLCDILIKDGNLSDRIPSNHQEKGGASV